MTPFPIDRALLDRNLLGAALGNPSSWSAWLAVLRAAFGLPLSTQDAALFSRVAGDRAPPKRRVRELWAVIGRRSGKSRMAAALAVFFAGFVRHKLAPGEVGTVLVLAASQSQASTVFGYALGFMQSSPVLAGEVASTTANEVRLRNGTVIAVHANSFRTVRGRTLLACIFDEVSFWRDESTATPDVETYRAVMPSLATSGGMLVGISTPYRRSGLLHAKHRDHYGQPSDGVLVVQGDSRAFNPLIDAEVIASASADDPEAARSEWEGTFRSDIAAFLDDAVIEGCVDRDRPMEIPPQAGMAYAGFCDPSGGRHDAFTLGIGHRAGERIICDVLRARYPPFDPEAVAMEFATLAKNYNVKKITGDAYSGEWVTSAFQRHGVVYERSDLPKSGLYLEGLPMLMRGLVSIPDHPRLLREMRLLERRTSRVGKDIIDHGRNGSDDHANALFGMLRMASAPRIVWDWNPPPLVERKRLYRAYRDSEGKVRLARREPEKQQPDPWVKVYGAKRVIMP